MSDEQDQQTWQLTLNTGAVMPAFGLGWAPVFVQVTSVFATLAMQVCGTHRFPSFLRLHSLFWVDLRSFSFIPPLLPYLAVCLYVVSPLLSVCMLSPHTTLLFHPSSFHLPLSLLLAPPLILLLPVHMHPSPSSSSTNHLSFSVTLFAYLLLYVLCLIQHLAVSQRNCRSSSGGGHQSWLQAHWLCTHLWKWRWDRRNLTEALSGRSCQAWRTVYHI